MNYNKACELLDLAPTDITQDKIKKQYRIKALQYHPDKCCMPDASTRFTEIHDAYEYLLKYEGYQEEEHETNETPSTYQSILVSFLKNILKNESRNQLFYTILHRISTTCEDKTLKTLEQLDKNTLIRTYEIVSKYWRVLHFSENMLEKIQEIIKNKVKNDECIILNPTLDDLFDDNIYKLSVGDFNYIVPLWHHELIYDNSGGEVIVKCYPMLDDNVYIDDQNNIHIEIEEKVFELWQKTTHVVRAGKKSFNIIPNMLRLTPHQTVTFQREGISLINTKDVYDVSKRGNVLVHIELSLL